MSFPVSRAIATARRLTNDTSTVPEEQRYRDEDMVDFAASALNVASMLRPDLFTKLVSVPLVPGVMQATPAGERVLEVYGITGGRAVREVTREALDEADPEWRQAAPGTPTDWMRLPRSESRFMVYPPVPVAGELAADVDVVDVTLPVYPDDLIALPARYATAIAYLTAYFTEVVNDEAADQNRASGFYTSATELLGVARDTANAVADEIGNPNGSQKI